MKAAHVISQLYYKAYRDTIRHDGVEHAGYIAFLFMLSIFPSFIFFTAIIGGVVDSYTHQASGESLVSILSSTLQDSEFSALTEPLQARISEITSTPPQSFLGLAIFSVIWSASSLLEGLRTILNRAYRVSNPPKYFLRRLLSIVQFVIITLLVTMITLAIKFVPLIAKGIIYIIDDFQDYKFIQDVLTMLISLGERLNFLFSSLLMFLFLSYIYYLLPNKKQKFIHSFPGTFNTMVFWWISTQAFKYYLLLFRQVSLVYGSVAGIIIALMYLYISSLIFIYGAEINYWSSVFLFKKKKTSKLK